jgi:hypothetical protein
LSKEIPYSEQKKKIRQKSATGIHVYRQFLLASCFSTAFGFAQWQAHRRIHTYIF